MHINIEGLKYNHYLRFIAQQECFNDLPDIRISFIAGQHTIKSGEGENEIGFACYFNDGDSQYIYVACEPLPDMDKKEYHRMLFTNIAHEVRHYYQDMNNLPLSEDDAEEYAENLAKYYFSNLNTIVSMQAIDR